MTLFKFDSEGSASLRQSCDYSVQSDPPVRLKLGRCRGRNRCGTTKNWSLCPIVALYWLSRTTIAQATPNTYLPVGVDGAFH